MNGNKDTYNDFVYELATDTKKRKAILANPSDYFDKYYDDKVGDSIDMVAHENTKDIFYFVMPYITDDMDISSIQAAGNLATNHVSTLGTVGTAGSVSSLSSAFTTIGSVSSGSSVSTAGTIR